MGGHFHEMVGKRQVSDCYHNRWYTSLPLPEHSGTGEREAVDKFQDEEAMLKEYAVHMKMLEVYRGLTSSQSWKDMLTHPYCLENLKVGCTLLSTYDFGKICALNFNRKQKSLK